MEIGTSISVKVKRDLDTTNTYYCKIIDKDKNYLYISYPTNIQLSKNEIIPLHEEIVITYIEKGAMHEFSTTVIELTEKVIPVFVVKIPNKNQLKKIQRRQFVRVEVDADVAVYCPKRTFPPFTSVTKDISGGGVSIIVPPNIILDTIDIVDLYIVLKSLYSDYEYIETKAEIIRTEEINGIHTLSLKFLLHDENIQQKIIKYCFEIQREKLKQESSL